MTEAERKRLEALKAKAELTDDEKKELEALEAKAAAADDKTYGEAYVKELRKESGKYRTRAKELEESLAKFDGMDPEEYRRLKDAAAEAEKARLTKEGDFEKLRQQLVADFDKDKAKLATQLAEKDTAYAALESELNRTIMAHEISIQASMAKAINPKLVEMVIMQTAKVEKTEDGRRVIKILDGKGEPRVDLKTGEPFKIGQLLEEMKQTEEFAHLFAGGKPGAGSGTVNVGGRRIANPWKKESFNLSEQGRIYKENPELANRLKAEAGE